jgi:ribosomal-protein-alanine N-acetyltransferase
MSGDFVTVASMTPDDLDEIVPLERQCFADPWTRRMYLSDLTTNAMATYLVVRRVVDDGPSTIDDRPSNLKPQTSNLGDIASSEVANVDRPSSIVAYGGFWLLLDEAHIATIASHPDWRGCGLGQWLMLALLDAAMARGAASSTLEVRAGNLPARRLYEKLGYEVTGVRKRYYRDGEDGLIMTTPLLAEPPMQARLGAARQDVLHRLERCFDEGRTKKDER